MLCIQKFVYKDLKSQLIM